MYYCYGKWGCNFRCCPLLRGSTVDIGKTDVICLVVSLAGQSLGSTAPDVSARRGADNVIHPVLWIQGAGLRDYLVVWEPAQLWCSTS